MITDLRFILLWWVSITIIGIFSLPFSYIIFKKFQDKGWGLSRILGILLLSYFTWLSASIHLLSFTRPTIVFVLIIISAIGWFLSTKFFAFNLKEFLQKQTLKVIVFEEILFFTVLFSWSIIRGFQPEINGLEKFMDFGFINSILRGPYMPPSDMWWAGGTINYYYFGHFTIALLTKISAIPSNYTFNLALASTLGLVAISSFSLIFTLTKKYWAGILAFLFVAIIGNLHTLTIFSKGLADYWYPDASRLVPFVINEFPVYTFVVSDLHAHLLDMPFVIFAISLIFSVLVEKGFRLVNLLFLSLTLGIMFTTSSWDFPIYILVSFVFIFYGFYSRKEIPSKLVFKSIVLTILIGAGALIFFLPFLLNFKPPSASIGFVPLRSPINLMFLLWGFWTFLTLSFIFILLRNWKQRTTFDIGVSILISVAYFLIILTEIIYVKDIYSGDYYRSNTVFKFTFQSWILLALASSYSISKIKDFFDEKFKILGIVWWFGFIILFGFTILYPILAIRSYYNTLKVYQGLDGTRYLEIRYPDDFAAIGWINKNIKGQPVIVEATGDSYTDYSRISANTGLPTVVGWPIHEWLWRGTYDIVAPRNTDVQLIYEDPNIDATKKLLSNYNVKYVYIGNFERLKYPNLSEEKFKKIGKIVFEVGLTKIYQVS
jgi:uncharacterized membrane protein